MVVTRATGWYPSHDETPSKTTGKLEATGSIYMMDLHKEKLPQIGGEHTQKVAWVEVEKMMTSGGGMVVSKSEDKKGHD